MDKNNKKKVQQRPSSKPKKKKKQKFSFKKFIFGLFVTGMLGVICAIGVYILIMINGANLLEENQDKFKMSETSSIVDRDGNVITELYRENREVAEEQEIPDLVRKAFVATEDRRFYTHQGIDLWSIGRALVKDIVARKAVEGASTITQQLAKNLFFEDPQKTIFRKATEASIAVALEKERSKDEILTMYLNRIYFGHGAYGIKAAAKVYFGVTDLNQLDLAQIATLAALPKAPNTYSPYKNMEKSKSRRAVVLKLMEEEGYITAKQREEATKAELKLAPDTDGKKQFMTFIDYVVKEAQDLYGIDEEELRRGGYTIYTTMNKTAQSAMETTYANDDFFQKPAEDGTKIQSSMVIVDNADGGIVAMIGGRDYKSKDYNRALSPLQPGSSFKPIAVYAAALESGKYNPYTVLPDTKQCFGNGKYCPSNYGNKYRGSVTMKDAIRFSTNIGPVWLLEQMGAKVGVEMAEKFGIPLDPQNDRNLSIALGGLTKGASPLQMAGAYMTFANGGERHTTHAIIKIEDNKGKTVHEFKPNTTRVISAKTAYYMTEMLQAALEPGGTGTRAKMDRPVAGKTGSSGIAIKGYEKYDSSVWFVGYTPEWTAAVWEGFDKTDTSKGHYVTVGSGSTAAIFKEVMTKAMVNMPPKQFERPKDVPKLEEPKKAIEDLKAEFMPDALSVQLNWSSPDSYTGYNIYRKGYMEDEFIQIGTSAGTDFYDMTIEPGETYIYYIIPYLGDRQGEKSNLAEVVIPGEQEEDPGDIPDINGPYDPIPTPGDGEGEEPSFPWPSLPPDDLDPFPSDDPSPDPGDLPEEEQYEPSVGKGRNKEGRMKIRIH